MQETSCCYSANTPYSYFPFFIYHFALYHPNLQFMWHERVKSRLGGSNPTFLAAEGSSTRPRILEATCRSASGGKGVPDQLPVKI